MASDYTAGGQLHLSVLGEDQIKALHFASLEILEGTGVFFESERALDMLRGAGASVDGNRVRLPSFLVDAALRSVPKRVVICNRDGERVIALEGNRSYFTGVADCPNILDPYTRSRRPCTSKDYRMTATLVDACPNIHGIESAGHAADYPSEVRAQAAFKHSMLNGRKPYGAHPLELQQMADIFDMAAAIAGSYERLEQAPFVIATGEPTTPLGIFTDASEILTLSARRGLPVVWYPMPSAGTTAPCTPAATIAIGNAEVLAGLVLHQLERPGAPFIYGAMPGMTDMRSTQWAYGSPDLALMVSATTDLVHYYGLPMYGTAGCSDAFGLDEQSIAESTLFCLMNLLSGANLIHDVGLIAGGMVVSPEVMVACDEIIDMLSHAIRPIDTSKEELALDLIDQVGPQGNYLALDHTLANFRRFWHSNVFLRNRLTGSPEDEPEPVAERINRKTREIIETHQVEPLPDHVLKDLDELEQRWMSRVTA